MIVLSLPANVQWNLENVEINDLFIEYRLDLQDNPEHIDHLIINEKSIFTWKDFNNETPERYDFLFKLIQKTNCLIDLEMKDLTYYKPEFSKNIILSCHLENKFDFLVFKKTIEEMDLVPCKFIKIAANIDSYNDLLLVRNYLKKKDSKILFLSTGKLGIFSRVFYKQLYSIGTYIIKKDFPTAMNQLTLEDFYLYNVENIDSKTKFGGIIGGKQIFHSKGLSFYNKLFKEKNINACYLPFFSEDVADLKTFIYESKIKFYGFSITMPFKNQFKNDIVNTWSLPDNKFYNSDLIAFTESFKLLNINNEDRILIIGSGAMAELIIKNFSKMYKITISARNQTVLKELKMKYNSLDISKNEMLFNLLINCTPLGLNDETLDTLIQDSYYEKVIDLVYTDKITPLVKEAKKKGLLCVDGHSFWNLQSKFQIEKFIDSIEIQ